jgi:hypothetical protein
LRSAACLLPTALCSSISNRHPDAAVLWACVCSWRQGAAAAIWPHGAGGGCSQFSETQSRVGGRPRANSNHCGAPASRVSAGLPKPDKACAACVGAAAAALHPILCLQLNQIDRSPI